MSKPATMSDHQWNWKCLTAEHGEPAARNILASRLRELAQIVEAGGDPDVFGYTDSPAEGKALPMIEFSITLSHPWPG